MIGPDGVGKSTLLALVSGVRQPQAGSITVLGRDVAQSADRWNLYSQLAFMPQGLGRNLYSTLSVEENINFFAQLFNLTRSERERRIERLTRRTGLHPFLDRSAQNLSGGMKQKLALCCALVHVPELLILDEPTTGIDPLSREQFWELIDDMREAHPDISVLVSTAYLPEARRFDRLIALNDGRIIGRGSPDEADGPVVAPETRTVQPGRGRRKWPDPDVSRHRRRVAARSSSVAERWDPSPSGDDPTDRVEPTSRN